MDWLIKIIFLVAPVDPESSIQETKSGEQVPEGIVDLKGYAKTHGEQEEYAEAKYNASHSIIHYRSPEPVPFLIVILRILTLGHVSTNFIATGKIQNNRTKDGSAA